MSSSVIPRAVAYMRMSTDDQKTSIGIQQEEIEAKFSHIYEIVGWYKDEGKSGSHSLYKRKDFLRLLEDIEARKDFSVVLCYSSSRFSRLDTIETSLICKVFRDHGIRLVTVLDGEIDFQTSTGRIMNSVLAEGNHQKSVSLAKTVLDGRMRAFNDGKIVGQCTPYGLARLVTDQQGNQKIIHRTERFTKPKEWTQTYILGDPSEVEIVKWLFKEFFNRDVSFHRLAVELNGKGVPSPSGKKKWCYQTVHDILVNVRYVGSNSIGKNAAGKHYRLVDGNIVPAAQAKSRCRKKDGFLVKANVFEGIIDQELFDNVQKKVEKRWRSGKHASRDFLLTGILHCGHCGKLLYGNERIANAKNRAGVRYVCKGIHRGTDCGQWGIREEEILPFMTNVLLEKINEPELRKAAEWRPIPNNASSANERRLKELESDYSNGLNKFLKMTPGDVANDLQAKLENLKKEINQLKKTLEKASVIANPREEYLKIRLSILREIREKLIHVKTGTFYKGYSTGYFLERQALRELLNRAEVKVDLFFERASKCRWKVSRGRLRVGSQDAAQFESTGSADFCGDIDAPLEATSLRNHVAQASPQISQGKTRNFPPIYPPHLRRFAPNDIGL